MLNLGRILSAQLRQVTARNEPVSKHGRTNNLYFWQALALCHSFTTANFDGRWIFAHENDILYEYWKYSKAPPLISDELATLVCFSCPDRKSLSKNWSGTELDRLIDTALPEFLFFPDHFFASMKVYRYQPQKIGGSP
jgi:hypothetical protein